MASTQNLFEALKGAENQLSSKKKNKKKSQGATDAGASTTAAPAAAVSSQTVNGVSGPVSLYDACEGLESAVRSAASIADKCKLWKEWLRLASEKGPKAGKYKDLDGTNVDFRQVLIKSRAVELSVEGAFGQGLSQEREELLSQLLLVVSPRLDIHTAQTLATTLGQLSRTTVDETVDIKGAAQRAVQGLVASLKASASASEATADSPVTTWSNQVNKLSQNITKEQSLLGKLTVNSKAAPSREHTELARKIFKLTGDQFDLLQPGALPQTSAVAGSQSASSALEQLRSSIDAKLRVPVHDDKPGKGGKGGQNQQLIASLKREETALAQQADQIAAQIRAVEAQLRSLRTQHQDVEGKRAAVQQKLRMSGDSSAGSAGKGGARNSAHYQEQLGLVDTLSALVLSGAGSGSDGDAVAAVQAAVPGVGSSYVEAARQYLELSKAALAEVPSKITFCKQRQERAAKLQSLGAKDNAKMKEEADKLMSETVRSTEDLLRYSMQVAGDVNSRYDAIMRALPDLDTSTSEALRAIDSLVAEIRSLYDAVQVQIRPPAPVAAPVQATPAPAAVTQAKQIPVQSLFSQQPAAAAQQYAQVPVQAAPAQYQQAPAAAPQPQAQYIPVQQQQAPPAQTTGAQGQQNKSAFDAAAAYLASMKPVAPGAISTGRKASPGPGPVGGNRPAFAAPVAAAGRSGWGRPASAAGPSADGSGLPTPAEAFKAGK